MSDQIFIDQLCTNCGNLFDAYQRVCPRYESTNIFGNVHPVDTKINSGGEQNDSGELTRFVTL